MYLQYLLVSTGSPRPPPGPPRPPGIPPRRKSSNPNILFYRGCVSSVYAEGRPERSWRSVVLEWFGSVRTRVN
eukprot:1355402-Amorphochlora_amoeboformis.AAC.2